jgi:hypothetical protein
MVPTHVSREGNQFPARTCSWCTVKTHFKVNWFLILKNEREITYAIFKFSLNKRNAKL